MNKLQKGGLEPLAKVPNFKYTFNEQRKVFIGYIYPYAEYFINCITSIPFNSYTYNGNCEYINYKDKTQVINQCSSSGTPLYLFSGGAVYELLNKKYNNVDLYNYCDATGDMDVSLYPPKLTYDMNAGIYFLNSDRKINTFYSDFTKWTFENMAKNIESIQMLFSDMENIVTFDIDEYSDIPDKHKNNDFGYKFQMFNKFCVVGFLNEDMTMYKIQVVCKVKEADIDVIDHFIEIIIPLPEGNEFFDPSDDAYRQHEFNIITIGEKSLNIDNYNSLMNSNINAYISRKNVYGKPNEMEYIHKSINHIARLFYLYELIYKNQRDFPIEKLSLNFLYMMKANDIPQIQYLYYYKLVGGNFHTIKVDTKFFLCSYLELIIKNKYAFDAFIKRYPSYFINYTDLNEINKLHDRFNAKLFDDDLFLPSGILTFSETSGGKRKNKTHKNKNKRMYKCKRTKRLGKLGKLRKLRKTRRIKN